MSDSYLTVARRGEGTYTEQRSKFLSFALPVSSPEEALRLVAEWQRHYYDARHVCWAYTLGPDRALTRANDNGEPSGTAGRPILGQMESRSLTDTLVLVVRYFGGVKLGTGGLAAAYKTAAAAALDNAGTVERLVMEESGFTFPYARLSAVMRVARDMGAAVVSQSCEGDCRLALSIRKGRAAELRERVARAAAPYR